MVSHVYDSPVITYNSCLESIDLLHLFEVFNILGVRRFNSVDGGHFQDGVFDGVICPRFQVAVSHLV